jgi:catechol 2,3-dioxygenase-like lactoylglutathione lyase family enzyme
MTEPFALRLVLWTTDVQRLAEFLARTAGFEVEEMHPGFALLSLQGQALELHGDEAYRGHPWYDALKKEGAARGIGAELRLEVPDVEQAYTTAIRIGGSAVYAPFADRGTVECQVLAPDGYLVSFWSALPPTT